MSCLVIKMTGNHEKEMEELAGILKSHMPGELVTERLRYYENCKVLLLVFEKFYFRNGSYANLTVLLTETRVYQTADIIGSGGGEGLFNISLGANAEFAEKAKYILAEYGFREEVGEA